MPALALVAAAGCESMRPEGSYTGRDEPSKATPDEDVDAAPDSDDDIYEGTLPEGSVDEDDDSNLQNGADPGSPLVGDYWMRADVHVKLGASQLGITIKTTTDTRVYSLVTVRKKGAALEMRDWQCTVRAVQSCQSGCSKMSTTLRDVASSSRAYLAPRRTLTVEGQHWSVTPVPYAIGYKGDYANEPEMTMPTDASDPLVYDPDGGGKGVDFTTSVTAGFTTSCNLRVVQKVHVQYEGELEEGGLTEGALIDHGSDQAELSNSCSGAATEPTPGDAPNRVRLIRAPDAIDTSKVPWACPTLDEFEELLGD